MSSLLARRAIAEGVGVFFLVLAGCGALVSDHATGAFGHVGVCATFGLVVLVLVLATGHLSGAHLNPAVTLGFLSLGRLDVRSAASYVGAQLLGAVAAGGCLGVLDREAARSAGFGATVPAGPGGAPLAAEMLATFLLMFVIASVATDERAHGQLAALAIGGAVAVGSLWAGPISGASMNPARSFGPAVVSGVWSSHWIYWVGPLAGALAGARAYRALRGPA